MKLTNAALESSSMMPGPYQKKHTVFMGIDLYIDQRVYIPNPETEMLVKKAVEFIESNKLRKGLVLDVGTGSGNIAIAIAKQFPDMKVIATDISTDALCVAAKNIEFHKTHNIELLHNDLVAKVRMQPDLIVSDLPWGDDKHLLGSNTKLALSFMPPIAVFPSKGLLGDYVRLCEMIHQKNWQTSLLIETGCLSAASIAKEMPHKFKWEYIQTTDAEVGYSVTKIYF